MVGVTGFEPATLCPPDKCATRLRYTPTVDALQNRAFGGKRRFWGKETESRKSRRCHRTVAGRKSHGPSGFSLGSRKRRMCRPPPPASAFNAATVAIDDARPSRGQTPCRAWAAWRPSPVPRRSEAVTDHQRRLKHDVARRENRRSGRWQDVGSASDSR